MKSYRLFFTIAFIVIIASLIFSRTDWIQKESMGNRGGALNDENRICQTEYLKKILAVLMSPSVDPVNGYLSNKDVLNRIGAVGNSCEWNNNTEIEKKYAKFKETLADTNNPPNQLNKLLIAVS
jgi:hypothetical protein